MPSYNKVILVGNLTRDPQMSYLPSQMPVVEFGMAINRKWKSQEGQQREEVCFVDCRAFSKSAETINQYCKKGKPILVEGRLQLDTWEGKDGTKHSKHRVIVERFQFLDSAGQGKTTDSSSAREGDGHGSRGTGGGRVAGNEKAPVAGTPPRDAESPIGNENAQGEGYTPDIPF